MAYPLIFSYNGEEFARVNYDGSWSVKWDKATDVACAPVELKNCYVVACAKVLLAGKDNFMETSWAKSDTWVNKWSHAQLIVDLEPDTSKTVNLVIRLKGEIHAKVDRNGDWSVLWGKVDTLSKLPPTDENYRFLAVASLMRLLMAAKDNFKVVPWNNDDNDDDDDDE